MLGLLSAARPIKFPRQDLGARDTVARRLVVCVERLRRVPTQTEKARKYRPKTIAMPYDIGKRLRLYGLVENLDDAVRSNDLKTAHGLGHARRAP